MRGAVGFVVLVGPGLQLLALHHRHVFAVRITRVRRRRIGRHHRFGVVDPGRLALMASQVSDAYGTKTRVDPRAVWTDGFLPPRAELNILPPVRK